MSPRALLLALSTLLLAGGALAQVGCDGLTFFGNGGNNVPSSWGSIAQQSNGNSAPDQMIYVPVSSFPVPIVFVSSTSPLLVKGGAVPSACLGTTRRMLLGAAAAVTTTTPTATVVTPGSWTLSYNINGTGATTLGPFVGNNPQPPPQIKLGNLRNTYPDGSYCMYITTTVLAGSATVSSNGQTLTLPAVNSVVTRPLCFYKLDNRPTANITWDSCNTTVTWNLTNIVPMPLAASPTLELFQTVFHLYLALNKTYSGASVASVATRTLDQYVQVSTPTSPNFLQFTVDATSGLVEGDYLFSIDSGLSTAYPDLVSLPGPDVYPDGSSKVMGYDLLNTTMIHLQFEKGKLTQLGTESGVTAVGDVMVFTWTQIGNGATVCLVDGKKVANAMDLIHCVSPLSIKLSDTLNHTLTVSFTDVCNKTHSQTVDFGTFGAVIDAALTPPAPAPPAPSPPSPPTPVINGTYLRAKANSASGLSTSFTAAAALLVAALFAAALPDLSRS